MLKADYRYFEKAMHIAMVSDFEKVHVGCVAVYQGNIIGMACNSNKTHPVQMYYNRYRDAKDINGYFVPKMHAEISCIIDILYTQIFNSCHARRTWASHPKRLILPDPIDI